MALLFIKYALAYLGDHLQQRALFLQPKQTNASAYALPAPTTRTMLIGHRRAHLLSMPPQVRTVAVARLASAPSAHHCRCGEHGRTPRQQNCARAGAYRAQTTCALARPRASKQAPQSIAQCLLPFSHAAPPSASRTRLRLPRPRCLFQNFLRVRAHG